MKSDRHDLQDNGLPDGDYGAWESPDPGTCESVLLAHRNDWSNELARSLAAEPTLTFIESGDRVMVANIDEVENGMVHATIQDCIITRRRFISVRTEAVPEEPVSKMELASRLADLRNCMKEFGTTSPHRLQAWSNQMWKWIEELDELTAKG